MKKLLWTIVGALLAVLLFVFAARRARELVRSQPEYAEQVARKLAEQKTEEERHRITVLQRASIGYPAGEDILENDHVYWVNVSGVDKYPDHTNYVALLQETKVRSSTHYSLSGTNRLFNLSTNLTPNSYYRVQRTKTNTWFERIPGPVPALQ